MLNRYQREFVSQGTLPTDNTVWKKISFGVSQFFAWIISSIKITRLTIEKRLMIKKIMFHLSTMNLSIRFGPISRNSAHIKKNYSEPTAVTAGFGLQTRYGTISQQSLILMLMKNR